MKTTNMRIAKGFSVIFFTLLMAMTLSLSQPVYAATITVTANSSDVIDANGGSCSGLVISDLPGGNGETSLREAICAANNSSGDDISLPAGTYTLSLTGVSEDLNATGDLDIRSNITITGQDDDPRNTIIQAGTSDSNGIDRVFHIRNGDTVTMEKITVRYGRIDSHGAGIYVDNGTLTLNESSVTMNNVISNSFFKGGGIRVNTGVLTLNNSTVSDNTALGNGAGIQSENGTLTINSSTISNNTTSSSPGGGIYISGGTGKINNSTIASNTSNGSGGGIYVLAGSSQIKNTIIADNTSTGGGNEDCFVSGSTLASEGYNLVEVTTGSCTIFTGTGDVTGSDPNLAALANNGGPTDTHAIQDDTSPAVDVGNGATCQNIDSGTVSEDQRGTTRAIDGDGMGGAVCDIGAYEFGAPAAVSLANFTAMTSRDHVVVTWDTVFESDNLGFDVYRSTTNERPETPLNEAMISTQAPGSGQGSSYAYEDYDLVAGTTYYYWLADVNLNHVESYHGPVTVVYDYIPTAITTSTLDSSSNSVPLAGLAALLGLALMAGGMLRRRDA